MKSLNCASALLLALTMVACSDKANIIFGPDPVHQINAQSEQFASMPEPERKLLFTFVAVQMVNDPKNVIGRRALDVLEDARQWQRTAPQERRGQAFRDAAKMDTETLGQALQLYRLDTGSLPTGEQGLAALMAKPGIGVDLDKWNGPYLAEMPTDPWGSAYQYHYQLEHKVATVTSFGADGKPGGSGAAADIANEIN